VAAALLASIGLLATPASKTLAERPKLVIVVTVDQLPFSYFTRFSKNLDAKGIFERIASKGASYIDCNHGSAFTITGPGHATLATGAYPCVHGVIDNRWFVRALGEVENVVFDETVETIGSTSASGASPRKLLVPTLGDALKLAEGENAKVFSLGLKDRAAIFSAGRLADGAFWFDSDSGNWVTSTAYRKDLPGYLRLLNEAKGAASFAGKSWEPLLPEEAYHLHRPDLNDVEKPINEISVEFPHTLPAADNEHYYYQLAASPFFNQYVLASSAAIIENEQLGKDETPDLLCINLSSNDYVGHNFGPYSKEVEDMFYRTDLQLGKFAEVLDATVGKDEWILAISSDHGVGANPVYARKLGLLARQDPLKDFERVQAILESQLSARFGALDDEQPTYVSNVVSNQVYLRERHPNLAGNRFAEAQRLVRTILLAHPSIVAAATRNDLLASGGAGGRIRRTLFRAFHPDRSGDVLFVLGPYQYTTFGYSASHGSPWRYDTHVPMMFLGKGVSGKFDRPVDPTMLAPTLARLLRIPPPAAAFAEPLHEILP
jgi:predicted AlkP superfamily pyrophosphatase or phosphodiesterase